MNRVTCHFKLITATKPKKKRQLQELVFIYLVSYLFAIFIQAGPFTFKAGFDEACKKTDKARSQHRELHPLPLARSVRAL